VLKKPEEELKHAVEKPQKKHAKKKTSLAEKKPKV